MENSNKIVFVPDNKENKMLGFDPGIYTHIRAYHACRPIDLESYFVEGIRPFHIEEMRQIAAATFGIAVSVVMNIEPEGQSNTTNHVYFSLFKNELLRESGHYLCWGVSTLRQLLQDLIKA